MKKNLKICIESQLLNHPIRSGLMTYTEGLVNGVSRVDNKNEYILSYYSLRQKADTMPGPVKENMKKMVVKVPDRMFPGREFFVDQIALPGFFKENKVDVFHRPSGYTMPKIKNVYEILTIHDLRTVTIGDQYSAQNIDNYRKTIASVNLVVVVSECTKKDLIEHIGIDEKKIKVVYLGADARYKPSTQEEVNKVKAKYNINEPFLLSVGSVPRKNIDRIIRGFAGSKITDQFKLVLGCKNDIEKYKRLIDELGMNGRIMFAHHITDDDIVSLYTACHSFVFPSLYEGFGLPILEAMHCGAPVITSNISSCPEVAGEAGILVNPNNIDEISEAINQVCQNTDLRESMIEKGYERTKLFSWEKFANEMVKIYEQA